jgi:hypothetical protein
MNRTALAAATAAVLLLLAGCTATNETASTDTGSSAAPAASEAPLVAQTPTATADGGETAFLAEVRAKLRPDNVIPNATDEQLLAAGEKACEVIATTANTNTVSLIDGEPANGAGYYTDSSVIFIAARGTLCD